MMTLLDWGRHDDLGTYVVTPPHALTLEEYVSSVGPCDELEVVHFGAALAEALACLHTASCLEPQRSALG